ncbi:MAG: flagellar hook-basal body complex protein FliE [Candidatus Eremiobacteraeota bacterium]|nr:flagellar hook-basal body complex protein FliE [Candidatus Eremiobacteraeota bacterium]
MQPFIPIQGISQQLSPIQSLSKQSGPVDSDENAGKKFTFANIMQNQLSGANDALNEAGRTTTQLLRGEVKNPHDVAIAGQKAGIMLKLTTTICSKMSSACTTLFQMQI